MARIDGREGIIVAGGSSDGFPAMTAVEFFDLENSQWLDMGTLRQGRLFPGLTTIGNHLYVLGGEAFDNHDQRIVFDSMEALLGNHWRESTLMSYVLAATQRPREKRVLA